MNLELDDAYFKTLNVLDSQNQGIVSICWGHMLHEECLSKYRDEWQLARAHKNNDDLADSEIQCSDCDHLANTVIISYLQTKSLIWQINNNEHVSHELKLELSRSDRIKLQNAIYESLNQIYSLWEVDNKKDKLVPEEFSEDQEVIIEMVVSVTAHMIELVDIYGTSWALKYGNSISLVESWNLLCSIENNPDFKIDIEGYLSKILYDDHNKANVSQLDYIFRTYWILMLPILR